MNESGLLLSLNISANFLLICSALWTSCVSQSLILILFTSLSFSRSVTEAQLKALWGRGVGHKILARTHSPTWELHSTVTDFTLGTDEVIWPRQMWPSYTWISNVALESVKNFTNTTMRRLLMFLLSLESVLKTDGLKYLFLPLWCQTKPH